MLSLFFALLPWLLFSSSIFQADTTTSAGKRIALTFSDSGDFVPEESHLELANSSGIDILEITDAASFAHFSTGSFSVLLNTRVRFPTVYDLRVNSDEIVRTVYEHYQAASELLQGQIIAVNTFNYPAETAPDFNHLASGIADSLSNLIPVPLYFQSSYHRPPTLPGEFRFTSSYLTPETVEEGITTPVMHFYPSENPRESLVALEKLFSLTEVFPESIIIIPAGWFFERVEQQPELEFIFSSYLSGNITPFPLPAGSPASPVTNWSVVLLFFIWASFIIHYRYQPLYAYSVSRYFLGHSFFVKDVMEHRIRNSTPGLILYTQHALLTGLFVYTSSEVLVSETGLSALSYHFPDFFVEGYELVSLFFLGVFTALVLQTISILWIYLFNNKLRFFSQVFYLYCWPFHMNLVVVTFLVVFNLQGSADVWIVTLSLIFGIIWFLSFNTAAIDSARFLEKRKVLNIFFTAGIHTLLVSFAVWVILNSPWILEPIRLAISLP